jgi:very-short-patch-repair endonuclease
MLWRSAGLIVELDGKRAHRTAAQRGRDRRKQEFLEGRGYDVLRFDWDEVHGRAEFVAGTVGRRL